MLRRNFNPVNWLLFIDIFLFSGWYVPFIKIEENLLIFSFLKLSLFQ